MRDMKNSGVPWIGEIPLNWDITINKAILMNISERNHPNAEVLSLYRDWGVVPKNSRDDNHNVTSENTAQYKFVECGDLVINKMKAWQGSLAVSEYSGIVSPAYYVCRFKNNLINKKFIHYLLRSCVYAEQFECLSTGMRIGQWDLSIDDFLSTPILLPNIEEQLRIVECLDCKCSQVDSLVANEDAQIEKLKQYKQSLITEVVTKGLNPDVEMKDSGVEWIGEIPKHWGTSRIKNSSTLRGRIGWQGLKSSDYQEEGPFLITGTDFNNGIINWVSCVHISEERFREDVNIHIKENDLLITKDGTIGKVAVAKKCPDKVSLNSGVLLVRNEKNIKYFDRYMYYLVLSNVFWDWYNASQTGNSTIKHLYQGQFENFAYPLPLIMEQEQISQYLDEQCSKIDKLIEIKQSKIAKLNEYKKSLIYEYVTGKKEV